MMGQATLNYFTYYTIFLNLIVSREVNQLKNPEKY